MTKKRFSALYVRNLKIDDLFGLLKTTIEISIPMKDSMNNLAKVALDSMEVSCSELEKRMKKTLRSILTPALREKNVKRNQLFMEIKRFVSTAEKSSIETLKNAGQEFKEFLTPYWHAELGQLNTITSIYEEILVRYHSDSTLQIHAATLGITILIPELESVNTDYDLQYKARNTEVSAKTGNSASEIKADVAKSYDEYCRNIEQSVSLMPGEKINILFAEMDGLRRKYSVLKSQWNRKIDTI